MNNFESLTDEELSMIDGGKSDREFGYEVGHDIAKAANWVWTHTIGCTPVY